MTYAELILAAHQAGYERIERDDRLLDVFPTQTKEKGVELWLHWNSDYVQILRIKHPYHPRATAIHSVPTAILVTALQSNQTLLLSRFPAYAAPTMLTI